MGTFELFDHTADLGVRVSAPDYADLVCTAAAGLYATCGSLVPGAQRIDRQFLFQDPDRALRLRDVLAELLHVLEMEQLMMVSANVEFDDNHLRVAGNFAKIADDSEWYREVKAVTYHDLDVIETPRGFDAVFIVDI